MLHTNTQQIPYKVRHFFADEFFELPGNSSAKKFGLCMGSVVYLCGEFFLAVEVQTPHKPEKSLTLPILLVG